MVADLMLGEKAICAFFL